MTDDVLAMLTTPSTTPARVAVLRGLIILVRDSLTYSDPECLWDCLVDAEDALASGLEVAQRISAYEAEAEGLDATAAAEVCS